MGRKEPARGERTAGLVKWLIIRHEGRELGKVLWTEENERHFQERFLLRFIEVDDHGSRHFEVLGRRHERSESRGRPARGTPAVPNAGYPST